jgi:hypothetical protein
MFPLSSLIYFTVASKDSSKIYSSISASMRFSVSIWPVLSEIITKASEMGFHVTKFGYISEGVEKTPALLSVNLI